IYTVRNSSAASDVYKRQNESGAIQGCRTVGSAEVAHSAINNQSYATLANLVSRGFLDARFTNGFNGYTYADTAITLPGGLTLDTTAPTGFGVQANPQSTSTGRYSYGIAPDQVVRYEGSNSGTAAQCGASDCAAGDAIGTNNSAGS
ncbi:MAG: hypothetical protein QUT30_06900, partial [Acidobacteriota bacterium]|nr:hypothetical protein [Acidobacteriota bacterium]